MVKENNGSLLAIKYYKTIQWMGLSYGTQYLDFTF